MEHKKLDDGEISQSPHGNGKCLSMMENLTEKEEPISGAYCVNATEI